MNKYYKLLVMFKTGEKVARKRLLRIFDSEMIDSAKENGFLHTDTNELGEEVYIITDKGIKQRDE